MLNLDTLLRAPGMSKLDKRGQELALAAAEAILAGAPHAGVVQVAKSRSISQFLQKAQPAVEDLHISTELTNLSSAYIQDQQNMLAGGQGIFPVDKNAGFFFKYDRGDFFRASVDDARRGENMESAGGGYNKISAPYATVVYAWHQDVGEQTMAQSAVGDPVDDALNFVTQIMLLVREIDFDAQLMAASLWGTDRTGVAASPTGIEFLQWNDAASTPRTDLGSEAVNMHSKTGKWPNILALNPFVLFELLIHPDVNDAFKHTTAGAIPTLDALAAALIPDVVPTASRPRIVTAGGVKTTSNEGAGTDTFDYITGKQGLLAHVDPSPGLYSPSAWYNFAWTGLLGANAFGFRVRDLENPLTNTPHRIEQEGAWDINLSHPELGTFYDTAVA